MLDEILKNAKQSYRLRNLVRYNHYPKIKEENVLEHSAIVGLIVLTLENYYKFDVNKAVKMALVHDLPEAETSDIPHSVKQRFPSIKIAVENAEIDCICDFSQNISSLLIDFNSESVETSIVKFADIISCQLYAESEIELGNNGKMKKVLLDTSERIIEIQNKLEKFRK